jgi:hypothetical protein
MHRAVLYGTPPIVRRDPSSCPSRVASPHSPQSTPLPTPPSSTATRPTGATRYEARRCLFILFILRGSQKGATSLRRFLHPPLHIKRRCVFTRHGVEIRRHVS